MYLSSFLSNLMAYSMWLKILTAINFRNLVLHARNTSFDVEAANIHDLTEDLIKLRDQWDGILSESKLLAESFDVDPSLTSAFSNGKRKLLLPDETVLGAEFQ